MSFSLPTIVNKFFGVEFFTKFESLGVEKGDIDSEFYFKKPTMTMVQLQYEVSAWKESVCRPLLDHELGVFRESIVTELQAQALMSPVHSPPKGDGTGSDKGFESQSDTDSLPGIESEKPDASVNTQATSDDDYLSDYD
jgi:hypothetical protein